MIKKKEQTIFHKKISNTNCEVFNLHAITSFRCTHRVVISRALVALGAGTMHLLAYNTCLHLAWRQMLTKIKWNFEQETCKVNILEAIVKIKISNCVICFMAKQWISFKSIKDLNLLEVLWRNTQYSHSWLHCLLNWKRDFRLKPGTCNMNPQSVNICWLESTPLIKEKRYTNH